MFAKRNILTIVSRINYIILFTLFNTQLTLINKHTQLVKMNIAHQNKSFEIYTDYSGSSSFAQLNCRDSNGAARKDSFRFKIHDGKYFTIPCRKKRLRERERESTSWLNGVYGLVVKHLSGSTNARHSY